MSAAGQVIAGQVIAGQVVAGQVIAGLDIGGTKMQGVLVASDGEVLSSLKVSTVRGPEGVVDGAATMVEKLAAAAGLTVADLAAVGAGVPGLVDADTGTVRHAVNLGVVDAPLPLADLLSARLGLPTVVDNDLNVAALGAAHLTDPHRVADTGAPPDLAFLSLGTGLAAGLVIGGVVRRGTGAAGEIGHVPLDLAGPLCPCGQRGCLELYASGTALERAWPSTSGRPAPVELFEAAAAGDPAAVEVRDRFADAVASAVRLLVLSVDPQRVLLGGGVSQLGTPLLEAVRAALVRQAAGSEFLTSLDLAGRVALAPSGLPVAAVGAAVLARP